MISDDKALRAAELIKRYCGERGCDNGECAFRQKKSGICPLTDGRLPEDWKLDGLHAQHGEAQEQ